MDFMLFLYAALRVFYVLLTLPAKYAAEPNPVLTGFVNKEGKASTLLTPGQQ